MSAEMLRRASARIRRDAERMPAGPYGMTSAWTTPNTMLSRVTRKGEVVAEVRGRDGDGQGCYTVMYFAAWHPGVTLAVADWLEAEAVRYDEILKDTQRPSRGVDEPPAIAYGKPDLAHSIASGHCRLSLAVARAYLGEQP